MSTKNVQSAGNSHILADKSLPFRTRFMRKRLPTDAGSTLSNPGRTKQSFMAECDIHQILKKFAVTGLVTHVNKHQGSYADLSDLPTFQEALQTIANATEAFDALPSHIRTKFQNDPGQFLEFVKDPDNLPQMVKLGLATMLPKADTASGDGVSAPPHSAEATPIDPAPAGKK